MKQIENINAFAKEVYEANKAKGFWQDREALLAQGGAARAACLSQMLMLITSECVECIRSETNYIATKRELEDLMALADDEFKKAFEAKFKDCEQDELADAYIRILDMAGGLGFGVRFDALRLPAKAYDESLERAALILVEWANEVHEMLRRDGEAATFGGFPAVPFLQGWDIDAHIAAKLRYNGLRAFKHGKRF